MSQPMPVAEMEPTPSLHAVPLQIVPRTTTAVEVEPQRETLRRSMPLVGLPATSEHGAPEPSRELPAEEPEPREFLENLTRCVLEVLAGVRDLDQLARWVSDDVYRNLTKRVLLSSRARQITGQRSLRPTFSIGRTLLSEPLPGVIEGVVIVHGKARTRAVALRIERLGARWRASAINVL